ncbi:hypothetical protein HK101_004808 [Irineochytrium annulatum]|nr:hypothetical protein HK101_004808 [Irineochytrium annulatum]
MLNFLTGGQKVILGMISVPAFAVGWFGTEAMVDKKENIFTRMKKAEEDNLRLYPVSYRKVAEMPPYDTVAADLTDVYLAGAATAIFSSQLLLNLSQYSERKTTFYLRLNIGLVLGMIGVNFYVMPHAFTLASVHTWLNNWDTTIRELCSQLIYLILLSSYFARARCFIFLIPSPTTQRLFEIASVAVPLFSILVGTAVISLNIFFSIQLQLNNPGANSPTAKMARFILSAIQHFVAQSTLVSLDMSTILVATTTEKMQVRSIVSRRAKLVSMLCAILVLDVPVFVFKLLNATQPAVSGSVPSWYDAVNPLLYLLFAASMLSLSEFANEIQKQFLFLYFQVAR